MWLISLIGKKNLVIIGAALVLIVGYFIQINRLESRIEDLEGNVALLTSQLEACGLREHAALAEIQSQNENIAWYEAQMRRAAQEHSEAIQRIKEDAANIKPQVITRWRDNPSCENGLGLIQESQSRIWTNDGTVE